MNKTEWIVCVAVAMAWCGAARGVAITILYITIIILFACVGLVCCLQYAEPTASKWCAIIIICSNSKLVVCECFALEKIQIARTDVFPESLNEFIAFLFYSLTGCACVEPIDFTVGKWSMASVSQRSVVGGCQWARSHRNMSRVNCTWHE